MNRIGNLLVPNSNYCAFEDWVLPILDQMVAEQAPPTSTTWAPSDVIRRLGKEINDESSVYYWCWKVRSLPLLPCLHTLQADAPIRITSLSSARPSPMALSATCSTSIRTRPSGHL